MRREAAWRKCPKSGCDVAIYRPIAEELRMIAARLGHHIDQPASAIAILSVGIAGDYPEFGD
jgi:hypothetical protein